MQSNYPNDNQGVHPGGFAVPHHGRHTHSAYKQSDFGTSGSNTKFGGFHVPDSTVVTVSPGSTPYPPPVSSSLSGTNESAWLNVKLDELKPDEHGEYLEPNAEKIYREKV